MTGPRHFVFILIVGAWHGCCPPGHECSETNVRHPDVWSLLAKLASGWVARVSARSVGPCVSTVGALHERQRVCGVRLAHDGRWH